MQRQKIFSNDNVVIRNNTSALGRAIVTVVIFIFCFIFLSSCAVWVRTPGDYGHGRHGDYGRHHGGRYGSR